MRNENIKIKKEENTYIMNIEGCYLYKSIYENEPYITSKMSKSRLYTATIPYSLEMIRLDNYFPSEILLKEDKKQYTKSIINITFDKDCKIYDEVIDKKTGEIKYSKRVIANKKQIRRYLYMNGIEIDGERYVFYKRGAAKARTGSCLFIKEKFYDKLIKRSRLQHNGTGLNIEIDEECDITSLHAYQSLILSGIEDMVSIPKKSILIVADLNSKPFETYSSVTHQKKGKLITENKKVTRSNNMTDGEGLIDESIFMLANREDKGMMLLRSDFFKCCGLNTKIQEYYKEIFKDEYETKILKDMFGNEILAKDVRMITTPSSVKYLKFAYKFKDEADCYKDWLSNTDDIFGIVKSDKIGNYDTWNRLTYQIINSMPFNREDIKKIVEYEYNYVSNLKNDLSYFLNHINMNNNYISKLEEDLEEYRELDEEDSINKSYKTSEFISNAISINKNFQYTNIFKDWKQKQIASYIKELRKGKIRIKDTLYGTIFANPYELLQHSIGEYKGDSVAKGTEIYCPFYENNIHLATFRNPHINSGNVMVSYNKWYDEYKWFNLTNNVILINVSDNDFPDRGQGFDYDSDTLLLTNNPIVVKRAKECLKYPTPLNMVKGDSKVRYNNMEELALLDFGLSNNHIGKIINKSQIINSYMWLLLYIGIGREVVDILYNISSQLSSLSQIELDKAKKSFDNISMSKELKRINHIEYNGKKIIEFVETTLGNKMVVPIFFKYVAFSNAYRETVFFETPMDYLQEVLDSLSKSTRTKKLEMKDLFVKAKDITVEGSKQNNSKQHDEIYEIINKCNKKINSCMLESCPLNEAGKRTVMRRAKEEALLELSNLKINTKTIYAIINKCFKKDASNSKWNKIKMITLNLLYYNNPLSLLSIFKNEKNDNLLIEDECGDINLFGRIYRKS